MQKFSEMPCDRAVEGIGQTHSLTAPSARLGLSVALQAGEIH